MIWATASGSPLMTLREPGGAPVLSADFSPDGTEVLTASSDGTARIWSTATGNQLAVLSEPRARRSMMLTSAPTAPRW